ncbi:MAG: glycosyl hydrolase family 28-related protein [Armatimonadota bacterium]|nr:glycoside hydrolase family 55 protein [bacterium]
MKGLTFGWVLFVCVFCVVGGAHANTWNVVDAGALGDGIKDNTAIFQKLLDEASSAGGGIVTVPAGHFRINGNLVIPGGVTLQGTFVVPPSAREGNTPEFNGSVLLAYAGRGKPDDKPFIQLRGNMATLSGIIVYYPEWSQKDVPPVPYPPCVFAEHCDNVGVLDCCLVNPYEGIRFPHVGRFMIRNVYGYPSWRGLYVDECYDIGRVENCHFWPFGVAYDSNDPYCRWLNTNSVAFEFARTDWQYVLNTFCFGYGVGYKFSESKEGSCNGNFVGIGADSCRRGVLVEQSQPYGLLITNGEFVGQWGSNDSVGLEISSKNQGKVSLNNCAFWGPLDKCVWMRGDKAQFSAIGCNFVTWDVQKKSSPAIELDGGNAIIQGCTFGEGDINVAVGENVQSAILMGNQAEGKFKVDNRAGEATQLIGNKLNQIKLSAEALAWYRLQIGTLGDYQYITHWGPKETDLEWDNTATKRWSSAGSKLVLPVLPWKSYTVTMEIKVPQYALEPGAGIYMNDKRLISIDKSGIMTLSGDIPASASSSVTLDVKCKNWSPKDVIKGNQDPRVLGIAVRSVTMKVKKGASGTMFNANIGRPAGE